MYVINTYSRTSQEAAYRYISPYCTVSGRYHYPNSVDAWYSVDTDTW